MIFSINRPQDAHLKDTAANIVHTNEFVVNIADEAMAEQMHRCGRRLQPDISELAAVGLTTLPSQAVAPPRIAEAPAAFKCMLWELFEIASRQIFIGQVRWMHARDGLIDTATWRVPQQTYFPGARFGASVYLTTRDRCSYEAKANLIDKL